MSAPSGISAQVGFKSESTFGTAVVVDKFVPFNSEGVKKDVQRLDSMGLRAGRRITSTWKAGKQTIGGPLELELPNITCATLLRHMFGTISTTGSSTFTHTASPGDLTSQSLTIQVGRPDIAGTVRPFTYAGCKFPEWELKCGQGEIAMLTLTVSAQSETTGTSLASVSYTSGLSPFVFHEGQLAVAGTTNTTVNNVSIKANNSLAVERHRLGSALINEQLESGFREYTGQIDADFQSLTEYNRFVNANEFALVLQFSNGTDSLTITTNARYDGETPVVEGPELLAQPLPFKIVHSTSDASGITAVLVNTDSSAT